MNGLVKHVLAAAMATQLAGHGSSASEPVRPAPQDSTRPILAAHCLKCHGPEDTQGAFRLDTLSTAIDTIEAADRWQKVLNVLNAGEMPPDDEKQIEPAAKADLLDDLARVMVAARKSLADSGGAVTMRRLNRREYGNTLRDLLGVEIDVQELPADMQSGRFDTVGSGLFISADQIEQYHSLGMTAIDEAWKRYGGKSEVRKLHVEAEEGTTAKELDTRLDARKRFLVWKQGVEEAAAKPENEAVVAEIRKARPSDTDALLKASDRLQGAPSPKDFGWTDGIHALHEGEGWWKLNVPYHKAYASNPLVDTGALLSIYDVYVHPYQAFSVPGNWPPGDYVLRIRLAATDESPAERRFIEFGRRHQEYVMEGSRQVTGTLASPQILEIPISISTDGVRGFWIYEKGIHDTNEKAHKFFFDAHGKNGVGPPFAIWIDWIEAEGPLNADRLAPPALAELLTVPAANTPGTRKASAEEDIRGVLERFATRAFRGRQPTQEYLDRLVAIFKKHRDAGKPFRAAVQEPLAIVLSSPHFLYLAEPIGEQNAKQARRPLDDLELASRLSYFLWSSPPDDTLLEAARAGDLQKPAGRSAQVDRMLADARSREFVAAFTHQWLGLDRLDFFQFNDKLYPDFDLATKAVSKQEIFETIGLLIRENLSLKNLLKSDFVVADGVLAQYYGLDGVSGDEFRKIKLPAGSPRGGLLGMAAVLAMGSNGEHSSPVERGAWVLRKLLHDPPPPAPPNVPQLTRLEGQLVTARERLRLHQEEPQCASCHRRIDPIGFGLENFDAVGKWRTEDSYVKEGVGTKTWPIEPAGALHSGPAFKDFYELREIIASRPEAFATGFTEALLEYALGRPCGFSDDDLVKAIVKRAADKDYSVREFVHAVVQSRAFRTK